MRIHRRWAQTASAVAFAAAVAWAALALPTSQAAEPVKTSLPCFEGKTPDGKRVSTQIFAKRRGIVFAFGSDDPDADRMADVVEAIRAQAASANIALLGVARDPAPVVATNFMKR